MGRFAFVDDPDHLREPGTFLAEMPASLRNKGTLLAALSGALRFPDGPGRNWDSTNDWLHDLAWIPQARVVLYHPGVAMKDDVPGFRVYLDLLVSAVDGFERNKKKEFVPAFHSASERRIRTLCRSMV